MLYLDNITVWQDPQYPTCNSCWQLQVSLTYLVAHEIFALVVLCIQSSGNKCIHLLLVCRRNAVPDLWRTVVQVVKAVQFHVLSVPEQHPHANDQGHCSACLQGMHVHL